MKKYQNIPTNIITGFLGSGKTTVIRHLLQHKPTHERWAVLVNEFGEVGIDGALMNADGIAVKEVAGGCMCCAVGLPSRTALNRLIKEQNPHRIIIEPTGLAHPRQVLDMFSGPEYDGVLDIRSVVCLIDPWSVTQDNFLSLPAFIDQVAMADVLVATKADVATVSQLEAFQLFCKQLQLEKSHTGNIANGKLALSWLDFPHKRNQNAVISHHSTHKPSSSSLTNKNMANDGVIRSESNTEFAHSCGWEFPDEQQFDFDKLLSCIDSLAVPRVKAVFNTNKGNYSFNRMRETTSTELLQLFSGNRIEMITTELPRWIEIDLMLRDCRR